VMYAGAPSCASPTMSVDTNSTLACTYQEAEALRLLRRLQPA
jgi:hypothetical protein